MSSLMVKPSICLSACPEDILRLAFESLDFVDLRALSLVSKYLRAIAEPFLYSEIRWAWLHPSQAPPITLLLRSILCRPQLATYIQSVIFHGGNFYLPHFRGTVPTISVAEDSLHQLTGFIINTKVSYSDFWVRELRYGKMDAFVALLLSQLSNLRCLHLSTNFTKESQIVGMVLRSALCKPVVDWELPNFEHLRDISFNLGVDTQRDKSIRNTADILPFFYLPKVQHISATIENPVVFTWPAIHPPTPSTLVSLDLSFLREAHLGQLLSVTKGLKTLRWEWYHNAGFRDPFNTPVINLTQIATAISHVQHCLTDLAISAGCDAANGDPDPPPLRIVGSLDAIAGFDALKRFEVPLPFLLGFLPGEIKRWENVVPQNIEFLIITDDLALQEEYEWDDRALFDVIRSWLDNWKLFTPCLCGISLLLRNTDEYWGPVIRNEFKELCAGAGIQCEITKLLRDL